MSKRVHGACCALLLCAGGVAGGAELTPFTIRYDVQLVGPLAAKADVRLEVEGERLSYASTITPKGPIAALFGDALEITARMRLEDGRVVPDEYRKQHRRNRRKDEHYVFSGDGVWAREKRTQTPHPPGDVLDEASMQLQLTLDAAAGGGPWNYRVVAGHKLRHYRFSEVGVETIGTALGEIETLRIRRERMHSNGRAETDHYYWLSPTHGHLPVKVQRIKDGKVKRTLQVKSLVLDAAR